MLDHISISVTDLCASRDFYSRALAPLASAVLREVPGSVSMGRRGVPSFWLAGAERATSSLHLGFTAENRAQVDAFHRAAFDAVEVVCHRP